MTEEPQTPSDPASDHITELPSELDRAQQTLQHLLSRISRYFIGQPEVTRHVLVALLANGHVLLEGVPGLGKTLLVRLVAHSFDGSYKRIQFTPDLMPADVTGHAIYDMQQGEFQTRKGPVFTNLLLADEINRAPAKSQAALLEVMQERQVTIDGESLSVPHPFMVLATQNPIEQEGTYALPEAELDRFLMKVKIDYPTFEDEIAMTQMVTATIEDVSDYVEKPLLDAESVHTLQRLATSITVDEKVIDYAVRIVRATRESRAFLRGAGPRASIALVRCARAAALLQSSGWVTPDHIKQLCLPVLRHRISLAPEIEIQGADVDNVLLDIVDSVDAPRT